MSHSLSAPQNRAAGEGSAPRHAVETNGAQGGSATDERRAPVREFSSRFSGNKVGFGKLVKSEFIKITSLRSTYWLLGIAFALTVGFAALFTIAVNSTVDSVKNPPEGMPPGMGSTMDAAREVAMHLPIVGAFFSILVFGAWAVTTIAGEYGTGMIRSTMTAAPKRWPALLAKLLVTLLVAAVVAFLAFLASYGLGQVMTPSEVHFGLGDGNVMRSILMTVLYVVLVVLMGFGLGLLTRNAAGGIVTIVGILFALPLISGIFGGMVDWVGDAARFLPSNLGQTMGAVTDAAAPNTGAESAGSNTPTPIKWNEAALWLALESGVIWLLGMITAQKRDV
ncbi:ABC transporter permease [Falsarthrobacter nasiphocae]|uniref:ABC-2 type transporter transmembrane domain-containing protein n=1 Tax=Falsarthrobacter nasiphocae TaxID=189863 RepID=A0AAE3YHM6_9MICC|nr:ABC transporter permease [Falsarthrobacter nasiphocae]MDR6892108.1 hypothetical protein [Falsarthrobacter nasiphocae]